MIWPFKDNSHSVRGPRMQTDEELKKQLFYQTKLKRCCGSTNVHEHDELQSMIGGTVKISFC